MSKLGKIITTITILVIGIVFSLTILLNIFLSEDKLKSIIIPQAEKALGRQVTISGISVKMFSGIIVKNMIIKEADSKQDFAGIKEFILQYELMPLLHKRLVITEIMLREPQINIHRDAAGNFNFSSLALLAAAGDHHEPGPGPASPTIQAGALPIALTVDRITINQARLTISDELKELPEVKGETDAVIGVDIAGGLSSLQLNGELNFIVDAVYQQLKPHVQGTAHFDHQQINFNVNADLDNEKIQLAGSVADYLAAPDIKLDISSKELDVDHLLGLMAGLAGPEKDTVKKEDESAGNMNLSAPAAAFPAGLKAQGKMQVETCTYNSLKINNILMRYSLVDGILNLTDMGVNTAGGKLTGKTRVDLNKPGLAYDGQLQVDNIKIEQLISGINEIDFKDLSGAMRTNLTFNGSGISWPQISKTLLANGDFSLLDGQIQETRLTRTLANLLKLKDLQKFSFEEIAGNLKVKDGGLLLKSAMHSKDITAVTKGRIGLEKGTLNLPLSLKLSPELSRKLQKNLSIAKYMSSENGETELNFKVGGTVQHPEPVLDEVAVKNVIIDIGGRELNNLLSGHKDKKKGQEATKEDDDVGSRLLKGILGK